MGEVLGFRYGHLRVISRAENKGKSTRYNCQCDCGATKIVYKSSLTRGEAKHCGCITEQERVNSFIGQKFGRLTVVSHSHTAKKRIHFKCKCDCGAEKICQKHSLIRGLTESCGCLQKEKAASVQRKHSLTGTPLYKLWKNIITRTTNPEYKHFKNYGGRGIKMHPKWEKDAESFVKYLRMALGPKPTSQHSLDRIDNEKGYIPGNLRWATKKEQANNRRPRQRKSA